MGVVKNRGLVWVEPTVAVNANDPVWFNNETGFRVCWQVFSASDWQGARWETSCGVGGRALPGNSLDGTSLT